jgi:phage FluMu protein Com
MVKTVRCTECKKAFEVTGERRNMREVEQGVTCPYCQEPNEVLWPVDMAFFVRKIPCEM